MVFSSRLCMGQPGIFVCITQASIAQRDKALLRLQSK